MREPCGNKTVTYVDCGGGFMNLHMRHNCTETHAYTNMYTGVHVQLVKS